MGSKPGSVAALHILLERGWNVLNVVVCPNISHSWYGTPNLEEFAKEKKLSVVETQEDLFAATTADFVLSYMYRYRVNQNTLTLATRAALNFHAAPLPQFGGFAFYNVAILEEVTEFGCTCHYMDEGFDTGPLLKVRRFPIDPKKETAVTLERKSQQEMIRLFYEFTLLAETKDSLPKTVQDDKQKRYMSKDEFEALKEVPPGADAETIDRYARAFWYPPYPPAYLRTAEGKVDLVPKVAKETVASKIHSNDLSNLMSTVKELLET